MFKTQEVPSQTQPETNPSGMGTSKAGGSTGVATGLRGLDAVPEEEEETTQTQARTQRSKRKAPGDSDEDVEMGDEEPVRLKRRAVEGANAVAPSQARNSVQPRSASKPPSSSKALSKTRSSRPDSSAKSGAGASTNSDAATNGHTGAQPGKPDKDSAFLKAVASTKRGKKHEDEFDREFNKLKISKPDLAKEDEARRREREYAVLEEFGYDGDMRGNFMVVVEIEVKERKKGQEGYRRGDGEGVRQEWVGRPDFKKFKRVSLELIRWVLYTVTDYGRHFQKVVGERRRPVDLYVEDESGFAGMSRQLSSSSQSYTLSLSCRIMDWRYFGRPYPHTCRSKRQETEILDFSHRDIAIESYTQGREARHG